MYPYSQELTGEGGLANGTNYVRNSVKVTVDAYQGTVTMYVFDEKDPIIRAWQKAFPDLFTAEVADARRAEGAPAVPRRPLQGAGRPVRPLPRDGAASASTTAAAKWLVSPDPGNSVENFDTGATASGTSNQPQAATSTGKRIDPYYLNIQLPGDDKPNFVLLTPFVPVSSGNSINRLSSFLTAKSDPGSYGELQSFTMPSGENVDGPIQVSNQIDGTQAISTAVTLLNQQGLTGRSRGASSSSRSGTRSSTCARSTCGAPTRAGTRSSSSSRCSPRTRARCARPTVDDAINRLFTDVGDNSSQQATACTTDLGAAIGSTGTDTSRRRQRHQPSRRRPRRPRPRRLPRRARRRTSSTVPPPSSTRPTRRSPTRISRPTRAS